MSFLSPWFFLGLAALAGPLIAHLRRLSVARRIRFSAVDLLEAKPPRSARKRWDDVLLMAVRMTALALLSLAFARPYFNSTDPAQSALPQGSRLAILLDTSASMRRGTLFSDALQKASALGNALGPEDELEILSFDHSVRPLLRFESWRETPPSQRAALLKDSLESAAPTWANTRLDEALRFTAEQQFEDAERRPFEVAVISDFQDGSSLTSLQGAQWPAKFTVQLLPVAVVDSLGSKDSVALHWVSPDPETAGTDSPFQVQVHAAPEFSKSSIRLVAQSQPSHEWLAPVSPGRPRITTVPSPPTTPVFIHPSENTDPLSGVWAAPLPQARTLVALGGGGAPADHSRARYFNETALHSLGSARVELLAESAEAPASDSRVGLWIAAGGVSADWSERMRSSVKAGAKAFIQLESPSDTPLLASLLGDGTSITEAAVDGFAILGEIQRTHPLFAPFRSPPFSDFTGVRFWKYRRITLPQDSDAKVLARFEGGDPALIECALGKGKLLIFTSVWKPEDSQWVLSSRCVPFLASCLEWSGTTRGTFLNASPGESVSLPAGTTGLRIHGGASIPVATTVFQADAPGVYAIEPAGGVLVVNIARSETQFAPMDPSRLQTLRVPLLGTRSPAATSTETRGETGVPLVQELESRQGLWRYLLAAMLGVLLLETLWAGRLSSSKEGTA